MVRNHWFVRLAFVFLAAVLVISPAAAASPTRGAAPATSGAQRLVMRAKSAGDYAALKQEVIKSGAKILIDQPEVNLMVVSTTDSGFKASAAVTQHAAAIGKDHIEQLVPQARQAEFLGKPFTTNPQRTVIPLKGGPAAPSDSLGSLGDPAFSLPGLMWNVDRINTLGAWRHANGGGIGNAYVKVGVADTGLDYTHADLANKVVEVHDFTVTDENPNICSYYFGLPTDAELATSFGAPSSDLDFNGHGSWIGGNIAAAVNVTGTNGIAPLVGLVALKISQNCGSAYDSTIMDAFIYAADHGIDIVSISFGGYLDRSDPDQDTIYQAYVDVVSYARSKGTLIVASAGNEHAQIGAGGLVIGHGTLDVPPGGTDLFGLWETPGGIPGVIDVSATGNVVNAPSTSCPADSLAADSHQWCKPASDAHQPFGVGLKNQLTYYSNYGPRIDVAAPGGARKFNVQNDDRGGTEGWPWTGVDSVYGGTSITDTTNAWEDFSITSNYATEIPCFTFSSGDPTFPADQCYAIIQGTSMATPHVSAALAVYASSIPSLWRNPDGLVQFLKSHAAHITGNTTPPASATDTTPMDRTAVACPDGYCHLGGPAISDAEAYGAGLVDVSAPFWLKMFMPVVMK